MKLILIRHGESEANVQHIISNTGYRHGLTETGRIQVLKTAEGLERNYKKVKAIYASPLKRAIETADIISSLLNMKYEIIPELAEFNCGVFEGKSDSVSWQKLDNLWNEWFLKDSFDSRIEEGESLNDIIGRIRNCLDKIASKHAYDDEVLCVGHGGTYKAATPFIVNNMCKREIRNIWLDNADSVEIDFSEFGKSCCKRFGNLTFQQYEN